MTEKKEKAAFVCAKDTLEGAYPALILAINAVREGMEAKIFHTFMGLNMVIKGGSKKAKFIPPGVMGAIPGMSSVATGMMKKKVDHANIPNLEELQEVAQLEGVELVACKMTIDMMEVSDDRLLENVPVWTASDFIKYAKECEVCLFT